MIELRDVVRRFGNVTALSGVSFTVRPGEIVALLGPNGAGKTTATRIIAGILAPTEGDATVDGVSVRADPQRVRRRCGLVTDSPSLYEWMTLRSYLTYFAHLYDVADVRARIAAVTELMGLSSVADRKLGSYSRGMKQKAAIGRGLVHEPPVLLLDEPATALDPEMTQTLRALILSLRAQHRAILLCTHDLDEAQRIADRVIIIDRGRVVREAATSELRQTGRPAFRAVLVAPASLAHTVLASVGITADSASEADGRVELRWTADDPAETNTRALGALIAAGVKVVSLTPDERSLEEAYLAIVTENRS